LAVAERVVAELELSSSLGFFIVECASLEQAIATATELGQASSTSGSYEIRPLRLLLPEAPRP